MNETTPWERVVPDQTDFLLPGWDDAPEVEDVDATADDAGPSTSRTARRVPLVVGLSGALLVAVAGAVLIYFSLNGADEVLDAPAPPETIDVSPEITVAGPDGIEEIKTASVVVDTNRMRVADMEPLSVFIPALGSYSEIVPAREFESSRYADFDTLAIPGDPAKSAWYSGGGQLADNGPGSTGTTLIASHVGGDSRWGVFRELYTLKGGELVYLSDTEGELSAWKVTQLYTSHHTDFPQEYWDADGQRQLVLTTCAEYDPATGNFVKNIFAVAVPVDVVTWEPYST